jgi:hypothetical protein
VLKDLMEFVSREKESIWGKIYSIMQPLFYRFPKEIMEIYLQIWVKECTNVGESAGPASLDEPLSMDVSIANTELLMKCLETIVVSNFPINIIVHAFLETTLIKEIYKHNSDTKKQKKRIANLRVSQL